MNKALFAFAGVIVAAGLLWYFTGTDQESTSELLISPTLGDFRVTISTTGELRAKNSIEIFGPRNVQAANIYQIKIANMVPEGSVVKKGDFVAELDKSDLASKLKELQLSIQKAESQYTQAQLDTALNLSQARDNLVNLKYTMEESRLRKGQSIYEAPSVKRQAEIDYEKAERSYNQAQKSYITKKKQAVAKMREVEADLKGHQQKMDMYMDILAKFNVTAPSDGMVIYAREWSGRKKVVGSMINAWHPVVATLPDLSIMESLTYVNEIDIQKLQVGQSVQIGLDAQPDKNLSGTIQQIANVGEQRPNTDSKVFEVLIRIDDKDTTLRPAMTTSNDILVAQEENVLFVPLECIHAQDSLTYVYKESGSGLVRQQVSMGLINDSEAIITEGLAKEDLIHLTVPENTKDIVLIGLNGEEGPSESTASM